MIANPLFIISILLSSTLAFFAVQGLMWVALKFIKSFRWKAFLRLLPFVALLIDPFFTKWSIGNWINPLSCDSCIQSLMLHIFSPELKGYLSENEISLINYLGGELYGGGLFFAFLVFISAFFVVRRLVLEWYLIKSVQVVDVPIAHTFGIVIPEHIVAKCTKEELNAIQAHEQEHMRWKDPQVRLIVDLIAALFWWVPVGGWIKALEQDQEMACDEGALQRGIDPTVYASALLKVAKDAKTKGTPSLC